jgi:hypothetical protein
MSSLNYPEKGESITAWLRRLFFFIKTLEVKGDGKTCRIDRTSAGSVLHILPQGGAGGGNSAAYIGPFRIGFEEGKVTIRHGGNPPADFAGVANVNGDLLKVPVGTIAAATGFIILKAALSSEVTFFSWEISASLPKAKNGENTGYAVIGEIISAAETQVVIQYQNSCPTILIGEECSSD